MRKTVIAGLLGSAFALAGTAQAALLFDLNGMATGGQISALAFDWAPTSFLARGGNAAIANFRADNCGANLAGCEFNVYTHARLTGYRQIGDATNVFTGLPTGPGWGEITMVARFTERVIDFDALFTGTPPTPRSTTAQFESTGVGWLEFYWSPGIDGDELTGNGFNNGTLIGRLSGVSDSVLGSFTVDAREPVGALDQTTDSIDNYPGQLTVTGSGNTSALTAGTTGVELDRNFFIGTLTGATINLGSFRTIFQNISAQTPFGSVNPSHCFNDQQRPASVEVGTSSATGLDSTCDDVHVLGPFLGQGGTTGYLPNIGRINGLDGPDFIAQTDFNMAFIVEPQEIPEPGTLALVGLALAGMGVGAAARRRRA